MNIITKEKFLIITPDEGKVFTSYTDEQDIKEYSSFTIAYTPLNADLSIYREITVEEDALYCAARDAAIEEEERERERAEREERAYRE